MSSPGHWEVVSKNKKTKQNGHSTLKLSKVEKKKFAENAPKVEDILPLAQVKNLYTDEVPSEVQEPKRPKETKSKEEPKKPKEKKQAEKKKDPKEKTIKHSSELDEGQLLAFISEAQSCYSEVPLAWLRDLATYITTRLAPSHHFPPQGSGKATGEWPSTLLPPNVRKMVESVLVEEAQASQLNFLSSCLTSLANDMSKGHSAIGQKIILQIHINSNPKIVAKNMDKLTALRNSYQNRPPICLALLETLGQAGYKDISTGLKVWSEIMFPLIEMRHYTRWVVAYLGQLTAMQTEAMKHPDTVDNTAGSYLPLASLSPLISRVMPVGNSLTSQVQKELMPFLGSFRSLAIQQSEQEEVEDFFLLYLSKLVQSSPKVLQSELLEGLMQCLTLQSSCFAVWQESYEKYLPQSTILLQHMSNSPEKSALVGEPLCQCLRHFESVNETFMESGEDKVKSSFAEFSWEDIEKSSRLTQEFLEKAKSSPKAKGFPYIKGSFLCVLGIIGLIIYDVRKHGGSFKDSSVGHLASDAGALPAIECAMAHVQHVLAMAYEWLDVNGPIYYKAVVGVVGPILANGIEAVSHLTACTYNYLVELYPVIMNWVDDRVPGFRDKCTEYLSHGWVLFQSYSWWALERCSQYAALCFQWAKENVFVGQLSAENLQKLSLEAYNMTQIYAGLTIDWLIGKMQ